MKLKSILMIALMIVMFGSLTSCNCDKQEQEIQELKAQVSVLQQQVSSLTQELDDCRNPAPEPTIPDTGTVDHGRIIDGELICDTGYMDCDDRWGNGCEHNSAVLGPCDAPPGE